MEVYVVTRDERPLCSTFVEEDACETFHEVISSGAFEKVSVLRFSTREPVKSVVVAACQ